MDSSDEYVDSDANSSYWRTDSKDSSSKDTETAVHSPSHWKNDLKNSSHKITESAAHTPYYPKKEPKSRSGHRLRESMDFGNQKDISGTETLKPLFLSETLNRVLTLNDDSDMKMSQDEDPKNLSSDAPHVQTSKSENQSAALPSDNHNSLLLSEKLENVLCFDEDFAEKKKIKKTESLQSNLENVDNDKTINKAEPKMLKRPIRTATRRLRSHTRSRRYQHERNDLRYSDVLDAPEVPEVPVLHSSLSRVGSVNDLPHKVTVFDIKRKRSHSADSSDFPASFSDSSPAATDPSTDEELPTCETCGKCFRRKYYLVKHSYTHSPNGTKPLYICKDCGKVIPTASVLRKHRRIHLNETAESASSNKRTAPTLETIKYEVDHLSERMYRCPYCFRSFNQFDYYRRHLYIHTGRVLPRHVRSLRN